MSEFGTPADNDRPPFYHTLRTSLGAYLMLRSGRRRAFIAHEEDIKAGDIVAFYPVRRKPDKVEYLAEAPVLVRVTLVENNGSLTKSALLYHCVLLGPEVPEPNTMSAFASGEYGCRSFEDVEPKFHMAVPEDRASEAMALLQELANRGYKIRYFKV